MNETIQLTKLDFRLQPIAPPQCSDCDSPATVEIVMDLRMCGSLHFIDSYCMPCALSRLAEIRENLPTKDLRP